MTRLGDVCAIRYGKDHKKLSDGSIPTYGSGGIMRYVDTAICEQPSVLIPRKGTLGNLFYTDEPFWTVDTLFWTDIDQTKIVPKYLYYQLKQKDLASYNVGTAVPSLTVEVLNEIDLDVPSIDKQRRIVEVLNSFDSKIALNNQLNDYLANLCETIASRYCNDRNSRLRDICYQVADHVDYDNANQETYVSTESLMQNKGGRQLASSLPTTGKITRYKAGDTLISNIRPYFKKIWYAPFEGTCSGDVIVFRANDPSNAPYLHACLRQDSFFDYVMQGAKGTKMPRGDKKQMMEFKVASSCSAEDLILLDSVIKQRSDNDSEITKLQKLRDTLLPKLMSGEIDVSKIDLTQLTNNHLVDC
ncbi:restriction endonuclease subunit S [Bifidobacterium longum]|uniref:restriction endonuclease subunit S n=1 Tax=Bifidobacterium longum TaxID=216816 RepID=UPI00192923A5|nr:restriction endonuclease subunit S [Bifidobacterium longum]MBL3911087.1 restriction endonuclease subunit S [Bifidobacterium longum subsp. longum]